MLFHLLGQPFLKDRLPGLQTQQVQNETHLVPKTVPLPVSYLSKLHHHPPKYLDPHLWNSLSLQPPSLLPTCHINCQIQIFYSFPSFIFYFSSSFLNNLVNHFYLNDLPVVNEQFLVFAIHYVFTWQAAENRITDERETFLWIWRWEDLEVLLWFSWPLTQESGQEIEIVLSIPSINPLVRKNKGSACLSPL